jgi:hypothetical protein
LEAEARREVAGNPSCAIPFLRHHMMGVKRGEGAQQIDRTLEKDHLISSFPPHPLVIVKAKAICLVAFHRNKNLQTHPEASLMVPTESGSRGFQIIIRT